jgi:hypothetical protein
MNIKIRLNKWIVNNIQKLIINRINIIIFLNKIKLRIINKWIRIVLFKD